MHRDRLLRRFLQYVRIDSTADDAVDRYPSSEGQWEMARLLESQLREIGAQEIELDEHGLTSALIPGDPQAPTILLNSHVDTSPEASGAGVNPQVIESYSGGDIRLPEAPLTITVDENPELRQLIGKTLITTDGTTLLGGDDKAGVAVIMELASHLLEHPQERRANIRVLFTCDEEIGRGADHVDFAKMGATAGYTLDGPGADQIDVETFSADLAIIRVRGVNIHPSIAKGRMTNAIRAAAALIDLLPRDHRSPETTSDREGFLHPYRVEGGVGEVTVQVILRDFDESGLQADAERLRQAAREIQTQFPGSEIDVQIRKQYRNLAEGLSREPRAVAYAEQAHRDLGRTAKLSIIRGGTDGALFTERGLPTPNLSTGQHNPHSPLEWACLDEMESAVEVLIRLAQRWAE